MTENCRATHESPLPNFSRLASAAWPAIAAFAIAVLIVILGPGAPPAAAADAQAGKLAVPKPPEFTAEDAKALQAAGLRLLDIQGALLNEKVSADDARRLTTEGVTLTMFVRSLQAKKQSWEEYAKSQAIPVGSAPQLPKLYEALLKYRTLYRRQFRMNNADGSSAGPEPLGQEWENIANDLEPFTRLPMTIDKNGTARYAMRALLVRGEALVYASVAYYRKKETSRQFDCYARGCAALEAASHPAEEDAIGVAWLDREQTLETPEYPYSGAELAGADDPSKYPVVLQMKSCDRARQVLAEFCPWGVKTYAALARAGILEGLDWRILLPYTDPNADPGEKTSWPDRSLLDYFVGYGRKYFWEHTMSKGPSSIEADFRAFQAGEFEHRGRKIKIKWRNAPKDVTYTIWVVSPMLSGVITSDIVGYVTDTVQLLTEGFQALVLDHVQDAMIEAIDTETDAPVYTSTSTIGEAETGDQVGVTYIVRKALASKEQLAKDNIEAVLGIVEKGEMEVLFESIDPGSDEVRGLVGNPKTYDGSDINPIIIRAYATGWEDAGENRFPRQWHYLRYYEFDPRALSGVEPYDLSQEPVKELPGLKGFLADDRAVQAEVWKLLPDKPKRIGTRLYVTDHSPDMQELEISVAKDLLDEWMKKDTPEKGVVGVIEIPEPYAGEYLMGPLKAGGKVTLGYALVNRRAGADAPFLGKVAWHARQFLPTLFRQYKVRILVCKKGRDVVTGNPMYYYDDREAYELASFPVRFTPTKGNPATGKLRGDLDGETYKGVVVMTQAYGESVAPTVQVAAANTAILPRVVKVESLFMKDGVLSAGDGFEFALKAYVVPCEPGGYHARIQIGPYTYHAWARVNGHGEAAVFSTTIPAPQGRNTVTVSCEGAAPATFLLERNPGKPKLEWANGELAKAQQEMNNASDARAQRWGTMRFWEEHVTVARELVRAAQYDQAKQYASAVLQQGPPAQAFDDDTSMASRWRGTREDALLQLVEAAYYSGDGATIGPAASGYVQESTDRMSYEISDGNFVGGSAESYALYVSSNQARVIKMAVAAGADAGVLESLEQDYLSMRQKAGSRWPQYDNALIYYGPKGGSQ